MCEISNTKCFDHFFQVMFVLITFGNILFNIFLQPQEMLTDDLLVKIFMYRWPIGSIWPDSKEQRVIVHLCLLGEGCVCLVLLDFSCCGTHPQSFAK